MSFALFISFVIALRVAELFLSTRNERWLLSNGAVEYGHKHYPFIVLLHMLFIASLIFEHAKTQDASFSLFFLIFYFLLIALKCWIILSLGKFWNTKIYRIANASLVTKGPYKYVKHPNYIVVIGEIAVIPLVFHLYYTAIIFSLLNAVMLSIRIKEENKALRI